MSEFDLIRRHFSNLGSRRTDVVADLGDDCAVLRVPPGMELAVSIDTLVAGVHFLPDCDPVGLGHKTLAVGLSDLAAMGAEPAWATLALTLPERDDAWLAGFRQGLDALAKRHAVALVGGDTTRGPLTISLQVHGLLPAGQAIRRDGARAGDRLWVSGTLGDAGLALRQLLDGAAVQAELLARLERPTPRVELGQELRGMATAMIDLSDGLVSDLHHILVASGCAARVQLHDLPLSPSVAAAVQTHADWGLPTASGDDYELLFTAPAQAPVAALAADLGCAVTAVGTIEFGEGAHYQRPDGGAWSPESAGWDHFHSDARVGSDARMGSDARVRETKS